MFSGSNATQSLGAYFAAVFPVGKHPISTQQLHLCVHLLYLHHINVRIAMNNLVVQPVNDSASISEEVSTCSWEDSVSDDASNDDSDEEDEDLLADVDDEEFWEEDTSAVAWLARNPGGTPLLYPKLFVIKPRGRGGRVVISPSHHSNGSVSFLQLPSEIRNRIYGYYFDIDDEVKHPEEERAPFHDHDGNEIQRICLSTENVELKFWLSTALLQSSRQLRYEAMYLLFSRRVFTVEWLPALPRFVQFLGAKGCAMVRYIDIWDSMDFQGEDNAIYQYFITSITQFSSIRHLRIVLAWSINHSRQGRDRIQSWFNRDEWLQSWFNSDDRSHKGALKKHAVPKMRSEEVERYWPEYEILKNLKAEKFTLAVETTFGNRYLEFDRNHGAYLDICKSMKSNSLPTESAQSAALVPTSSASSQTLEAFEQNRNQLWGHALTPTEEFDDYDSDSLGWQDTEALPKKSFPIYNFLTQFIHKNISLLHPQREAMVDNFHTFPTAQKSTGSIIRDCPFCYLSERHCGYHAVPDQPPFEPSRREGDGEMDNVETMETKFKNLSYVDMRETCRDVARWMKSVNHEELLQVLAVFEYLGWFEAPNSELLARLDAVVDAGWTGKKVDKDEVPPWDVLYREIYSNFGLRR